jgi:hypothetical protein
MAIASELPRNGRSLSSGAHSRDPLARNDVTFIARRANHATTRPSPFEKIYPFSFTPNQIHNPRRLVPSRGDRDRHERGTGCGGRGSARAQLRSQGGVKPVSDPNARRRTVLMRTAKSCGPDASTLASSLVEACRARPGADRLSIRKMTVTRKPDHRGDPEVSR